MPEMGGLEAARRIRGQLHLQERPWQVALTANFSRPSLPRLALGAGPAVAGGADGEGDDFGP